MKKILPTLFFMTDESWAMSMADIRKRKEAGLPLFSLPYYTGICATLYTIWVASSALGTVIGPYLGNVDNWGFGMAFPAVFLVLLRGMWKGWKPALPWLVSLMTAIAAYLLFKGAWYVPAGAAAGLLCAYITGGSDA